MACRMARSFPQSLLRYPAPFHHCPIKCGPLVCLSFRRHLSSKAELFEMELDSSSSSTIKKMDEIIHKIMVQKATPDWLPFLPGSSFWVPPRRRGSHKVVDLIEKLSNQLTADEYLSLTSDRGWPCLSFFIQENKHKDVENMNMKEQDEGGAKKVALLTDSENKS